MYVFIQEYNYTARHKNYILQQGYLTNNIWVETDLVRGINLNKIGSFQNIVTLSEQARNIILSFHR
jgi:hypothetical protein